MQPIKRLQTVLKKFSSPEAYLFTSADLRAAFSDLSDNAYKALLFRAVKGGLLTRVCRDVFLSNEAKYTRGKLLYHVVNKVRPTELNYISLESQLSDSGLISQMPLNWLTIMSSGRSRIIKAGDFGTIEFVHTKRSHADIIDQLDYDANVGLWRANNELALRDLRRVGRNVELVSME
jgi:predicted transcriptional regulator of viral defense system